jgi:hypothetical protein
MDLPAEKTGNSYSSHFHQSNAFAQAQRILGDEGFFRTLKIGFNIIRQPKVRRRINEKRGVFNKYKDHINAEAIVAEKRK